MSRSLPRAVACCLIAALPGARALGPTAGLYAWQRAIAGMSAYCCATIISSPVDVLKCRLQVKQQHGGSKGVVPLAVTRQDLKAGQSASLLVDQTLRSCCDR